MDSKDLMENYSERGRLNLLLKEDALNKKYIATLGKSIQNLLKKYGEIEGAMPKLAEESSKNIAALEKDIQKMSASIDKNISKLLSDSGSSAQSVRNLERRTQNLVNDFTKSTERLSNEMSVVKKIVDTFSMANFKELKDGKDGKDAVGIADAYMDMGKLYLKFTDDTIKDLGKIGSGNDEVGKIRKGGRGETGVGIKSIARTSGDGSPGTTDVYTITFTDASLTPTTYNVYNGADGLAVVRDNLTTASATDALSANQGKVLSELVSTKAAITQEAWAAPTMANGWTSNASFPVKYFKDTIGNVHLKGILATGTTMTTAFTLPVGYRPTVRHIYTYNTGDTTIARVYISELGVVTPFGVGGDLGEIIFATS